MATVLPKISQTQVISKLDTYTHTARSTSMYVVQCDMSDIPSSGIILTIQVGGVTQATTSVAPAARQKHVSLRQVVACTASDVISVIVSSSAIIDTQLNGIKGIISIHPGSV